MRQHGRRPSQPNRPFGFNDRDNLPNLGEEHYERFIRKRKEAFNRSREPFVIHFRNNYDDAHEPHRVRPGAVA